MGVGHLSSGPVLKWQNPLPVCEAVTYQGDGATAEASHQPCPGLDGDSTGGCLFSDAGQLVFLLQFSRGRGPQTDLATLGQGKQQTLGSQQSHINPGIRCISCDTENQLRSLQIPHVDLVKS